MLLLIIFTVHVLKFVAISIFEMKFWSEFQENLR